MKSKKETVIIPDELITGQIYLIRGQKVMLDKDLAKLYGVETKVLKQAVKRNIDRFPEDFMFELTLEEANSSRSQFVTLKRGENIKYLPIAFTEQGIAMLSSVLNSKEAIRVNIQIIRIFTKIRQMLSDNTALRLEIEQIKKKLNNHGQNIELVFKYLDELIEKKERQKPRRQIGYKIKK
jgi:hypothetical protein